MTPSSPGDAVQRWLVIVNDREGKSPSPTELRLGRMFHGSATDQRRGTIIPDQSRGRQVLHETPISSVRGAGLSLDSKGRSLLQCTH
jgi:hypothetical protein